MSAKRVIFIPGNGGGQGSALWFREAANYLEARGIEAILPDMPDPELARAKYWLPVISQLIADKGAETVLVGHSSGTVASLRTAETMKLYGSILVAAYYTDLGLEEERQAGYFDTAWRWDKIRQNQEKIVLISSDNDPDIALDEPTYIAKQLNAQLVVVPGQEHFVMQNGKYKKHFPELIQALSEMIG